MKLITARSATRPMGTGGSWPWPESPLVGWRRQYRGTIGSPVRVEAPVTRRKPRRSWLRKLRAAGY